MALYKVYLCDVLDAVGPKLRKDVRSHLQEYFNPIAQGGGFPEGAFVDYITATPQPAANELLIYFMPFGWSVANQMPNSTSVNPLGGHDGLTKFSNTKDGQAVSEVYAKTTNTRVLANLGRVDGFDDDETECKGHDGAEVSVCLLAPQRHAFEAFEFANRLLDAGACPIERLRKESGPVPLIGLVRDHRSDAALATGFAIAPAGVSLVGHGCTRRDLRSKIEQGREFRAVARLTAVR